MQTPKAGTQKKARAVRRAREDLSRSQIIAQKLKRAVGDEDPAHVAGAIVIFATETIQRSANDLMEARGYLDGIRGAIDGLLKNAFADEERKPKPAAARPVKPGPR